MIKLRRVDGVGKKVGAEGEGDGEHEFDESKNLINIGRREECYDGLLSR